MATVTGLTAPYMQGIVDDTVIGGHVDGSGHLILEQHDGTTIDAGSALVAVPAATTSLSGIVELATNTEAVAGTDAIRAITPATAKAIIDALILNGLADVTITSAATNDTLQWNGTQWVNRNFLTVPGDVTAAKGIFSSDVSGVKGTFTGDVAGVKGTFSGDVAGAKGTFSSDVAVRGLSIGNGPILAVSGIARSATSGSTAASGESILSTTWSTGTNSMTLKNGYLALVLISYQLSDNINSSYSITIPRLYTSGGTPIGGWVHYNGFNGHLGLNYSQWFYIKRIAGTDLTTGVGMTIQRYISGIAGTSNLDSATVSVIDMGKVSDHPGAAANAVAI